MLNTKSLSDADIEYFNDLTFTFGTRGWKRICEEAHKQIYQYQADALEKARSYDEVCYLRGQAEQLARIIGLEDLTANIQDELARND